MTEKKLDWNKPIETTEGYPAKVISDDYVHIGARRRMVQINLPNGNSVANIYYDDGKSLYGAERLRNKRVKHEAWQNIYRDHNGVYTGATFYKSEEEARKLGSDVPNYVATGKVQWEE
jgi:hypothetical protein